MRICAHPKRLAKALFLAGVLLMAGVPAQAKPATLATDAEIAAFAVRIKAYAGASRVRWVVAAPDVAQAKAIVNEIGKRLGPTDLNLTARIRPEALADTGSSATGPVGWMEPIIGQSANEAACSWQVWVSDTAIPSQDASPTAVPLASGDRLPVSPAATFRVGFTGLLQSKLYAFGETGQGAIRDLSTAPDTNIPVAGSGDPELLVLVRSRQPVPLLEKLRSSLGDTAGERRDLGSEFALRDNFVGKRRGIGANIQLVEKNMVVGSSAPEPASVQPLASAAGKGEGSDLIEACLFSLEPATQ